MDVTVYGDSILKGVLLEDGKYTVNRVWENLLAQRCGLKIRNRSRFGCTIRKALPFIEKDSETKSGELAILEFGGNDCDYDWAAISADPDRDYDCKTPPAQFRSRYRQAIDLLRRSGRRLAVLTLPPVHSERYLRFICRDGLSYDNILRWLGDVEHISRWQAEYSEMVRQIAREERVDVIDLRRAFPQEPEKLEKLLCSDGIHPSRSGQELIYNTLLKYAG